MALIGGVVEKVVWKEYIICGAVQEQKSLEFGVLIGLMSTISCIRRQAPRTRMKCRMGGHGVTRAVSEARNSERGVQPGVWVETEYVLLVAAGRYGHMSKKEICSGQVYKASYSGKIGQTALPLSWTGERL